MVTKTSPIAYFEFKDYCISVSCTDKVDVLVRELLKESDKLEKDSIIKVKLREGDTTHFNFFLGKDESSQSFVVPCSINKNPSTELAKLAPEEIAEGESTRAYKAFKFSLDGDVITLGSVALLRNYSYKGAQHLEVARNYDILKHLHSDGTRNFIEAPGLLYKGRKSPKISATQFTRVTQYCDQGDLHQSIFDTEERTVSVTQAVKDVFSSVETQLGAGIYSTDQKLENYLVYEDESKGTDFGAALWFVPLGDGGKSFKEEFCKRNEWTASSYKKLLYTPSYSAASVHEVNGELIAFHKKLFSDKEITQEEYEALKLRIEKEIVFQLAYIILLSLLRDPCSYFEEGIGEETQFLAMDKKDDLKSKLMSLGIKKPSIIIDALDDEPNERPTFKDLKEVYDSLFTGDAISST